MWPLRIILAKLRPVNAQSVTRTLIVVAVFGAFLYGDFALFRRLFLATSQLQEMTPFLALGLLKNLLALVFLVGTVVLFSSSMTVAIGSFFTDLDLDTYHAAPRGRTRIAVARWAKTLVQAATIVFAFLIPMIVAFARQYGAPASFYPLIVVNLALLLSIPVSLASIVILLLVRWFPVRRVHQIVATIAILVLAVAVIGFRMSRPERFFANVTTDDVVRVLKQIELPSMEIYPGTALAELMVNGLPVAGFPLPAVTGDWQPATHIALESIVLFIAFVLIANRSYFVAFVRARETMAPQAIGSAAATRITDRLLTRFDAPVRAMIAKEVRTVTRDVAQWSQVFLMAALMFIYLYNVRMLPLGGDARATIVAYANLGMAGFVISAICMRFAYPSVSAEGKAFWLVQTAPISYRHFLRVKVFVYSAPLTLLALILTAVANVMLDANGVVWIFTMIGASLLAVTLVSLGVAMGAFAPDFAAENPLQVGLSLGGFAYMAVSLLYVGTIMLLMARPIMRYFLWRVLGVESEIAVVLPVVIGVTVSIALAVFPLLAAEKRLAGRSG
jgi:ABC-2 type transport system permease protein